MLFVTLNPAKIVIFSEHFVFSRVSLMLMESERAVYDCFRRNGEQYDRARYV